jgi:hypothetical protein
LYIKRKEETSRELSINEKVFLINVFMKFLKVLVLSFIFLSFFGNNAFAKRKEKCQFKRKWKIITFEAQNGKKIRGDMRDYIINRDCFDVKFNSKKINKEETQCQCPYTNKVNTADEMQVEHNLSLYYISWNVYNCEDIFEIYNDEENLLLVDAKINSKKSNKLGNIKGINMDIATMQCNFCKKYETMMDCTEACGY